MWSVLSEAQYIVVVEQKWERDVQKSYCRKAIIVIFSCTTFITYKSNIKLNCSCIFYLILMELSSAQFIDSFATEVTKYKTKNSRAALTGAQKKDLLITM